ncbi:hypothetical protein [Thiorhodovibrio frisius]|uniref:Uncharacterized protein n=1 Tax=Thiorhodovibrio frisius TaxID=631362 RepID=H8Z6A7_9GAMM|nr:hypothetical protein [Thiorhodovibrio frisius]EIC20691.1 hypothetical protein Thi970DRAFT_04346 [Thiorhodovibrio frisius]WPL21439.1 hypothetical protein Thiofri_01564 [Thiorhodovibrio frisius]
MESIFFIGLIGKRQNTKNQWRSLHLNTMYEGEIPTEGMSDCRPFLTENHGCVTVVEAHFIRRIINVKKFKAFLDTECQTRNARVVFFRGEVVTDFVSIKADLQKCGHHMRLYHFLDADILGKDSDALEYSNAENATSAVNVTPTIINLLTAFAAGEEGILWTVGY